MEADAAEEQGVPASSSNLGVEEGGPQRWRISSCTLGGGSAGGGGPSAGSTWACRRGAGTPSPSRAKMPLAARGGDAAAHSGGGKATGRPEAVLGR